jgi:hypothetical protein
MQSKPDNQASECRQISEVLSAHFDGVANEVERQLASAHLKNCPHCAHMWREWQELRLMEQRAVEPASSRELLPLAPVAVPRHLKAAILRQTTRAATPIWQRFWPRLLTGMAVPTLALGCWLLIIASPGQQTIEINTPPQPTPTDRIAEVPAHPNPVIKNNEKPSHEMKPASSNNAKSSISDTRKSSAPTANHLISRADFQPKPISRVQAPSHAAISKQSTAKSTFNASERRNNSPSNTVIVKTPQISMASFEPPHSRAAKAMIAPVKPVTTAIKAQPPRSTEPVLVASLPADDAETTGVSSDPVLDYIAQQDVRPDNIRQAVENYRAALLDDGSDL